MGSQQNYAGRFCPIWAWLFPTILQIVFFAASDTVRAEPWRAKERLQLPEWLNLAGETRARYESLDGQFRGGLSGSDQLLAFRSLLAIEADFGAVAVGVELQDSRTYLDDAGTPLSSSFVDPLDVLQAYGKFQCAGDSWRGFND